MTKYPRGTKGTVLLILSGIACLFMALKDIVDAFRYILISPEVFRHVPPSIAGHLFADLYDLADVGLRHVALAGGIMFWMQAVICLVLGVMALKHAKDDEISLAIPVIAGMMAGIMLIFMFISPGLNYFAQLPIFLALMTGAILARKARVRSPYARHAARPGAQAFDPAASYWQYGANGASYPTYPGQAYPNPPRPGTPYAAGPAGAYPNASYPPQAYPGQAPGQAHSQAGPVPLYGGPAPGMNGAYGYPAPPRNMYPGASPAVPPHGAYPGQAPFAPQQGSYPGQAPFAPQQGTYPGQAPFVPQQAPYPGQASFVPQQAPQGPSGAYNSPTPPQASQGPQGPSSAPQPSVPPQAPVSGGAAFTPGQGQYGQQEPGHDPASAEPPQALPQTPAEPLSDIREGGGGPRPEDSETRNYPPAPLQGSVPPPAAAPQPEQGKDETTSAPAETE